MSMTRVLVLVAMAMVGSVGCASGPGPVPLSATPPAEPELTLVWVGRGECERLEEGAWVRRPELDYDFSVEQRRMGDHWESVKSMRRRHPGYDGVAGERVQTYFFRLSWQPPDAQAQVHAALSSSLGDGEGVTDREFRRAELSFRAAGVSSFAPFDRYRITQHYDYEAGRLTETVELNKGDKAWVRNREVASLYASHRFERAPTTR